MLHAAILIFLKYMFAREFFSVQCLLTSVSFLFENATPSKKLSYMMWRGNRALCELHTLERQCIMGADSPLQWEKIRAINLVQALHYGPLHGWKITKTNKAISQLLLFKWNLPKHTPDNLCSIIIDEKGSPIFKAQCRYLHLYIAFHFKWRMKQHKEDFISESSTSKHSAWSKITDR